MSRLGLSTIVENYLDLYQTLHEIFECRLKCALRVFRMCCITCRTERTKNSLRMILAWTLKFFATSNSCNWVDQGSSKLQTPSWEHKLLKGILIRLSTILRLISCCILDSINSQILPDREFREMY